jgi:enoyl-CoA hydratase
LDESRVSEDMMAEQSAVLYEQRDRTAIVTINRTEKRNAIDDATRRAITDAWVRFRDDPEALVAIITGIGDGAFSAGNDL